jgi:hypothetical protein
MAEDIPRKNPRIADDYLDETEIITRMLWVLHQFKLYDLKTFDWNVKYLTKIKKIMNTFMFIEKL